MTKIVGAVVAGANAAMAGASGMWNVVQAAVKIGMSTGAIKLIVETAGKLWGSSCAEVSAQKNVTMAMANLIEYEPGDDNIENLTAAIARLSYVLELELKAKKDREDAAKKLEQ